MDSVAAVPAQTPREISKLQPKGGVGWGGGGGGGGGAEGNKEPRFVAGG